VDRRGARGLGRDQDRDRGGVRRRSGLRPDDGRLAADGRGKKLIEVAARFAETAGAEVTLIDLADYELPLFNEDLEADGVPENAARLKALFVSHDGLLIAAPEYNSSITPLLKNTIDWVSRPDNTHSG
jgi:NAD(P)H-dependent FMN reductase